MAFPTGTPSYVTPTAGETLAAGNHTALHTQEEADIVALANKVGTGASTPVTQRLLKGTGTGTSSWSQADLTTDVTGVLPQGNGGTGTINATGTGAAVYQTSPTISGAQLTSSPTLTTPTIADLTNANHTHASSSQGGLLNGANAITDGTITPNEITSGTGSSWAWQSWVPTLTNLSGGTLNYAKYMQDGKSVDFRFKYTLAGAGVSGQITFSVPITMNSDYASTDLINATVFFYDLSVTTPYQGSAFTASTTTLVLKNLHTDGTRGNNEVTSSTDPVTFAAGDIIYVSGTYEAA